jgi:hypothetical protein
MTGELALERENVPLTWVFISLSTLGRSILQVQLQCQCKWKLS